MAAINTPLIYLMAAINTGPTPTQPTQRYDWG